MQWYVTLLCIPHSSLCCALPAKQIDRGTNNRTTWCKLLVCTISTRVGVWLLREVIPPDATTWGSAPLVEAGGSMHTLLERSEVLWIHNVTKRYQGDMPCAIYVLQQEKCSPNSRYETCTIASIPKNGRTRTAFTSLDFGIRHDALFFRTLVDE